MDRNNVNGLSDRADVSGNARHFCDVEFNYTGYEGEWSAFDPLPKLTQASEKDVRIIIGKERESYELEFNYRIRGRTLRTESLDRGNAKDLAQVVQNPSQCEGFGMWALLIMSKGFYIEHLEMDFQHF